MKIKSLAIASVISLALSGCAATAPDAEVPFDGVSIVASTNVWGDVASWIGGSSVEVTSIIDSFNQDPHSYEASARDQLAVNDADLVLANGGGYDSFMDTLSTAADVEEVLYAYVPEDLEAEDAANTNSDPDGHNHDHAAGNEHVWYDFHVVADFATRIAGRLSTIDPENAAEYETNLSLFLNQINALEDRVASLSSSIQGRTFISSEPVAEYLLDELKLENLTPASFSQAIEEELDASPKDLLEIENLIKNKEVDLFVLNIQTASPQIAKLGILAQENGVKTVGLSELLPDGQRFFEWMEYNILAIELALEL
jgi:zinc/manganese transport system substrate-binding protein